MVLDLTRLVFGDNGELHWQYQITDHLGNVVILLEDKDGDTEITTEEDTDDPEELEVLQRILYYPFGMAMEGTWNSEAEPTQQYTYNGKELDKDLGLNWHSFGFRTYDAVIGRFPSIDPIAEQFAHVSPYNYAENEPVGHIDLWGLQKTESEEPVRNLPEVTVTAKKPFQGLDAKKYQQLQALGENSPLLRGVNSSSRNSGASVYGSISASGIGYGDSPWMSHLKDVAHNMVMTPLTMTVGGGFSSGVGGFSALKQIFKRPINPARIARSWQGKGAYPGVDNWRNITLKDGKFVVGGLPGQSNFYTTTRALARSGSSKANFSQGLQVSPHPVHGYRPQAGIYKVSGDTPAAFGTTYANPHNGAGGLPQIFIPDYSKLELIWTIPLK